MAELYVMLPKYQTGRDFAKVGYTEDDVQAIFRKMVARIARSGNGPDADEAALIRNLAPILDGGKDNG